MTRILCPICVVLAAAIACGDTAERVVTLTVADEAGLGCVDYPITMGVPLPEAKVSDAARLVLLDAAGGRIPCQVREVSRWLDGKSVKWVHLTWLQSVPAGGETQVTLALAQEASPAMQTPLSAELRNGKVTVQTGFVKFVVGGAKFTGIEAAWFDPTGKNAFEKAGQVITGGSGSVLTVAGKDAVILVDENPMVTGRMVVHRSAWDADGKVEIEESGPMRVVVKATGRHVSDDGTRALDYIVRYSAYAGSPIVRVSHTFVSRQGEKAADFHWMASLNLDVQTALAGGVVHVGTEKAPLRAGARGGIDQTTSDRGKISHALKAPPVTVRGKSSKPLTTGWIDLSKGDLGLAVGIKWFWQMFPKRLKANQDGRIEVGLYPERSRPLEVYRGQSRTHYLTLVFHGAKVKPADLNAIFATGQRPPRAWAPPKYYCRETMAFGPIAEDDKTLFGENWPSVEKHNDVMLKSVRMLLAAVDENTYGPKDHRVRRDSYGIYAWGDRFHWAWGSFDVSPVKSHQWRQSWAGNYYDYPNAMLLQFLRTGEKTLLKRYWPNAVQIGDVHTTNWHPRKELIGACRYCPPRNFVSTDNGRVYSSNEFNHHKSQSVYARWYLTGDYRSLDHCRMLANNAYANRDADSGWAARGIGAQMISLWNAYELWGDRKYFHRMRGLAGRAMRQFRNGKYSKSGTFMWGIANEGLAHYYWVSGDERVIETFKAGYPKCKAKASHPNMALGSALTYRMTGDPRFADWAWTALGKKKAGSRVHGPGCQFRGGAHALFFLSEAGKDWKPFRNPLLREAGK